MHACFPCSPKVTVSCLSAGLAKRVGARLLLASTSEVYGGEWVSLRRLDGCVPSRAQQGPVSADSISGRPGWLSLSSRWEQGAPSFGWGEPFSPDEGPSRGRRRVTLPESTRHLQSTKVSLLHRCPRSQILGDFASSAGAFARVSRVPQPRRELRGRL